MNKLDKLLSRIQPGRDMVKTDSRKIVPGDVFVAIKGTASDGHNFIHEAFEKGAVYALCERKVSGLSEAMQKRIVSVDNTRIALGHIARDIFNDPSNSLTVYGVTGTNGKTTTSALIDSILNDADKPSGLISTVFTKTSQDLLNRSFMTTPDCLTLNRLLREMVEDGKHAAAIEISSHALSQERISGIDLDAAVFTNITPEHLDYHGSMAAYLRDKSRIFQNLKSTGIAVLNTDDPRVMGLAETFTFSQLVTYGMKGSASVRAENVQLSIDETRFDLVTNKLGSVHVRTGLIGQHNVYNMLAATAALINSKLDLDEIKRSLENAKAVPGRLDKVCAPAPFRIFIDYAHTPDAMENIVRCLRPLAEKRLISVFGCGGERDAEKRPVMGGIAAEICDYVILTNDNPRTESPEKILTQIENGMRKKNNYSIISPRRDAIYKALEMAKKGDIVVIAGKGHEDYQIIGNRKIPFNDKEVATEILKELGY